MKIGEAFERVVSEIQSRISPDAEVTHNEFLIDRLGQRRQFDVVIRGTFAGQPMLGVMECKDFRRRVGTPEVDAFCTKANDINANFRILASKQGFTEPAIAKAKHYGIRLVSLLDPLVLGESLSVGDWWTATVYRWNRITIQTYRPDASPVEASPESLIVDAGRILDWFQNYLRGIGHQDREVGWVVNFRLNFDPPIQAQVAGGESFECAAIDFHAERECVEYERFVPLSADAFFDWHTEQAQIPPGSTLKVSAPMDFRFWTKRDSSQTRKALFLPISIEAHESQFEFCQNAPDLMSY